MSLPKAADWVGDRIGDGLRAVSDVAGDVIKGAGNAIVKAVDYGADVVRAIAKDPIPTLLRYGAMAVGASFGIPPYVTSAAITAAQGGKLEDVALSAATSYATTSFMADTQIGADLKNYTVNEWSGDFTDSMTKTFNLPLDTAMQVAKVSNAALTSSLVGGINAAITGKSIAQGISSGFTSGLVYSGTNSYFDSVNKDPSWGFSPQALNLMKGVTSTALNTAISGKGDPAEAVGNYIAYASLNMAGSELWNKTKNTYNTFTEKTKDLKTSSDNVTALQTEYENKLKESETLRTTINNDSAEYKKLNDEKYTPFKTQYDNLTTKYNAEVAQYESYKNSGDVAAANAYADRANATGTQLTSMYNANKPMLDSLTSLSDKITNNVNEFNVIKYEIEEPDIQVGKVNEYGSVGDVANFVSKLFGRDEAVSTTVVETPNLAKKLKDASDKYQADYETWAAAQSEANKSAENYTKALAEVATRDATIDAVNSGAITATKQDDGNWVLSNGMTLTKDGEFIQEGVQQFTSAVGINQKPLDLTRMGGEQTAALGKDQITATDTPLIPLEKAPPLPDNTVTEVLTDAGLVDGSKDEDLISPAASDQAFQDALDRSTTSDIPVENKPIEDVLTDAGLVTDEEPPFTVEVTGIANPLIPLEEAPPLPDNTVTEVDTILKDLEEAPPLPDNTVTEVIAGEDNPLLPLEPAPPLPDNTVKEVIADTPGTPVTPKIPVAPKTPVTPKQPTKPVTPVTPTTPVKSTDPVEQLYQTTTQSQPTPLADIQYYLDMTGADILPPTNERNPVESLLNQYSPSMSIEELLRNLRS